MEMYFRMSFQEGPHLRRLVGRKVVQDDVDFSTSGLTVDQLLHELHELRAGVTCRRLAVDLATQRIECGVERKSAVPVVLKAVALQASRGEGQHRIQSVERLDRRLLVKAENRRVFRWFQVETDDVGRLGLEVGVVRCHVTLDSVRLEARSFPNLRHGDVADAELLGQFPRRPMRRTIRRRLSRSVEHASFQLGRHHPGLATHVPGVQSTQAVLLKAGLPSSDVLVTAPELGADLTVGVSRRQQQNHARPSRVLNTTAARSKATFQFSPFRRCNVHTSISHVRDTETSATCFILTGH